MRTLTKSSKQERSGHSRSLSFPSVCVFRLTNVIPERITFVSRGTTVLLPPITAAREDLCEILRQQEEFAATHGNQADVIAGMGVCSRTWPGAQSQQHCQPPAGRPADFCPQQHSSSQSINCPIHYKVIPTSQGTPTQHAAHKVHRHLHVKARF